MSAALAQQNLRIQIQDDLKYDIRFENADLDRYLHSTPVCDGGVL